MAQFLIVSIRITDPIDAAFTAEDLLNIYWDDSTEDFALTLNGSAFSTTGTNLGSYLGNNFRIVSGISTQGLMQSIAGYSFCDGTSLVWFSLSMSYPEYPFVTKKITTNSPVCDVGGGAVCDIHFTGAPVIVHSVDQSTGGSVTVSATSSNGVVKYGISSGLREGVQGDDYADLTNTTGIFTGLIPGVWAIYAKDANDCTAWVGVTVLYKPIAGEHYRFTWDAVPIGPTSSSISREERVRIYEREYPGSVVEINAGAEVPFEIHKPKAGELNNKLTPVHPTGAILRLVSEKDYQFLPLFTQDNKRYLAVFEVNENSAGFVEMGQWFFEPNIYTEDFVAAPYYTEFQLSDNVRQLENEPFTDAEGNLMQGDMKLIKVIAHIMKKTGLSLKIRSGINIFETNHTTAATDDPLDQTYIDVSCYRDGKEPFTCKEVLEAILKPFGARIVQSDNQWLVEEIDRAYEGYAYRVFDADGTYESNSTEDPVIVIKASDQTDRAALINQDHVMEVIPAYGKISLSRKFNYIGSIVAGGFEADDLLAPETEVGVGGQGVYVSEEGFNGWTLRLNGTTGVSFGRVIVGRKTEASRRGLSEDDQNLSVGAFFYDPTSWSGNLRNAYIESAEKNYQYASGDELTLSFRYSTPAKPEYEFMVLRLVLKVGANYLQPDGTWGASEAIYRAYPKISNSLQEFELSVPVPDTDVIVDTTVQVRIYFYASGFFDYGLPSSTGDPADGTDGLSDLDSLVTDGVEYDYRLDLRREFTLGLYNAYFRDFYELRISDAAEDVSGGIVHAGDFDASTNPRIWYRLKAINIKGDETNNRLRGLDVKFYLDDITLDPLINGQPPPLEDTISLEVSKYVTETLEVDLYNFDCPDVVNAKNMYNNYFKLSDGTPTEKWARSGVAEELPLTHILLKVLGGNHSAPTFRLSGSFINEFERVGTKNYLKLIKAGSNLSLTNTEFTSDLSGWSQTFDDVSDVSWAWSSGAAAVTLTGSENSKQLYQTVTNSGGYVTITGELTITSTGEREDILWVLFYNGSDIIHAEKLATFAGSNSGTYPINHTAFAPGNINRVGFFVKRVGGSGSRVYSVAEFTPDGSDVEELYQITDLVTDEKNRTFRAELMQQSKTYIDLSGIDTGGTGQSGSSEDGGSFNHDFNLDFDGGVDPPYGSEYQAILDYATLQGYTLPSTAQQLIENTKLVSMQTAGIWDDLDLFYHFETDGDENFAKINWKNPGTNNLTEVGTVTFTAGSGFTGDGSTGYLDTGWAPDPDAVNYTLDEGGAFIKINNETTEGTRFVFLTRGNGGGSLLGQLCLAPKLLNSGNNKHFFSLQSSAAPVGASVASTGFFHIRRVADNDFQLYKDGVKVGATLTTASESLSTKDLYLLAGNFNGSASAYIDAQIGCFGIGASFTGKESDLNTIFNS